MAFLVNLLKEQTLSLYPAIFRIHDNLLKNQTSFFVPVIFRIHDKLRSRVTRVEPQAFC